MWWQTGGRHLYMVTKAWLNTFKDVPMSVTFNPQASSLMEVGGAHLNATNNIATANAVTVPDAKVTSLSSALSEVPSLQAPKSNSLPSLGELKTSLSDIMSKMAQLFEKVKNDTQTMIKEVQDCHQKLNSIESDKMRTQAKVVLALNIISTVVEVGFAIGSNVVASKMQSVNAERTATKAALEAATSDSVKQDCLKKLAGLDAEATKLGRIGKGLNIGQNVFNGVLSLGGTLVSMVNNNAISDTQYQSFLNSETMKRLESMRDAAQDASSNALATISDMIAADSSRIALA